MRYHQLTSGERHALRPSESKASSRRRSPAPWVEARAPSAVKRKGMAHITQADCDRIAEALNNRPRKRHGYLTPAELYERQRSNP